MKIDLEISDLTQIIQKVFKLNEDNSLVITKRADVLILNDKDVKKSKARDRTELIQVGPQ